MFKNERTWLRQTFQVISFVTPLVGGFMWRGISSLNSFATETFSSPQFSSFFACKILRREDRPGRDTLCDYVRAAIWWVARAIAGVRERWIHELRALGYARLNYSVGELGRFNPAFCVRGRCAQVGGQMMFRESAINSLRGSAHRAS